MRYSRAVLSLKPKMGLLVLCVSAVCWDMYAQEMRRALPTRIAILVGNSDYTPPVKKLTTPIDDIEEVSSKLKSNCFFTNSVLTNKRRVDLEQEIERLSKNIQSVQTLVFYYAGHGYQIGEKNYLKYPVAGDDISFDELVNLLMRLKPSMLILCLDCCRSSAAAAEEVGFATRGLAPFELKPPQGAAMDRYSNVVASYAAAPNETALDIDPEDPLHSPYASALSLGLKMEGASLAGVLDFVEKEVWRRTKEQQAPRIYVNAPAMAMELKFVLQGDKGNVPVDKIANDITKWTGEYKKGMSGGRGDQSNTKSSKQ